MVGEQSKLGGADTLPVQRRVESEGTGRLLLTVGFVYEKERVDVSVQEQSLGLGKVADYVESLAKTVISQPLKKIK